MNHAQVKSLFGALVPLAQVTATSLCLYVSCYELSRFLAWDGLGLFSGEAASTAEESDRFHVVRAPGCLICGKPRYTVPVSPCNNSALQPLPWLVDLLTQAVQFKEYMLANRNRSIPQLAKNKRVGPSYFARMLRLNYLAPDIQAAIYDGTQPPGITKHKLLFGPMPLDWEQQRQLLGFG